MQKIDTATVKSLELRAPRSSTIDFETLQGQILNGHIFSAFNREDREAIWAEISAISGLIPSLYTMFEDIKYLHECADCMQQLISSTSRDTIFSALKESFKDANQVARECILQQSESVFVVRPGAVSDRFELGYRQLWLYAMRHFRQMAKDPKKNKLKAKPRVERANEAVLVEFGALAFKLGFDNDQIRKLRERSADREIARQVLLKARCPKRYEYDDALFESYVSQIVDIFLAAVPAAIEDTSPALVSNDPNASGDRCGFAAEDADEHDHKFLFIQNIHTKSEEQGESITSFFVRRSVYFSFFGQSTPPALSDSASSPHANSPANSLQELQSMMEVDDIESSLGEHIDQSMTTHPLQFGASSVGSRVAAPERLADHERLADQGRLRRLDVEPNTQVLPQIGSSQLTEQGKRPDTQIDFERALQSSIIDNSSRITPNLLVYDNQIDTEPPESASVSLIHSNYQRDQLLETPSGAAQDDSPLYDGDITSSVKQVAETTRIRIDFKIREQGDGPWKTAHSLLVDPSDPSEIERVAIKYMRKEIRLFNTSSKVLKPRECFAAAILNNENTIYLIPETEIHVNEQFLASITGSLSNVEPHEELVHRNVRYHQLNEQQDRQD